MELCLGFIWLIIIQSSCIMCFLIRESILQLGRIIFNHIAPPFYGVSAVDNYIRWLWINTGVLGLRFGCTAVNYAMICIDMENAFTKTCCLSSSVARGSNIYVLHTWHTTRTKIWNLLRLGVGPHIATYCGNSMTKISDTTRYPFELKHHTHRQYSHGLLWAYTK